MAGEVRIALAVTAETDDPEQGRPYWASRWDRPNPVLKWRGVSEGVPRLLEAVDGLRDSGGRPARYTILVRADSQIAALCGRSGWILEAFDRVWREAKAAGHGLGWHPHFYRWRADARSWTNETEDAGWIRECLDAGAASGIDVAACRCDGFSAPWILEHLARLGVRVESGLFLGLRIRSVFPLRNRLVRGIRDNVRIDAPDTVEAAVPAAARAAGLLEMPITWAWGRHPLGLGRRVVRVFRLHQRADLHRGILASAFSRAALGDATWVVAHGATSDVVRGLIGRLYGLDASFVRSNAALLRELSDRHRVPFRYVRLEDVPCTS